MNITLKKDGDDINVFQINGVEKTTVIKHLERKGATRKVNTFSLSNLKVVVFKNHIRIYVGRYLPENFTLLGKVYENN